MRKFNLFNTAMTVFLILWALIFIYMVLLKLTGHSPTIEQLNFAATLMVAGLVFKMMFSQGKFTEFTSYAKNEFQESKEEFRIVNEKLHEIDKKVEVRFTQMDARLDRIDAKL